MRRALAGVLGAIALALPASAGAQIAPPYTLKVEGSALVAEPAAGQSTLAVQVDRTDLGVEFRPAAATAPAGCTQASARTTCDPALLATELILRGDVLAVDVDGVSTSKITLIGGGERDTIVVEGPRDAEPGVIGTVALLPGPGNDSVTVRGRVNAITQTGTDVGDDRYVIETDTLTNPAILALGPGNDVASSSATNLTLEGGPGDDTLSGAGPLDGGEGNDQLSPTVTGKAAVGGPGDGDRLSFELVTAPLTLTKTSATDVQVSGDPFIKSGFERVEGGKGSDTLIGHTGLDVLFGGEGDDTIEGRGGGDILDGGPGFNTASYANGPSPVSVDLVNGTGSSGSVDTLRSFRGVVTGAGNDSVSGTSSDERFTLGAGADSINAGAGNDEIDGGPGNDTLRGGQGSDFMQGGADRDTVTYDERSAAEPINVTLASAGGDGAPGENDSLAGVEDIVGGASSDVLAGDDGPNALNGGAGLNTLDGLGGDDDVRGGDSRDVISGGPGRDALFGGGDDDSINAFDNEADTVDCGASIDDDAQVDGGDQVTGCEYSRRGDVPVPADGDGDGFVDGFDCNDKDAKIRPDAEDIVGDGIDQDCDGFDQPVPFVEYGLTLRFTSAHPRGRIVTSMVVTALKAGDRVKVLCKPLPRYRRRCPFTSATRKPAAKTGRAVLTSLFKRRRLPPTTTIELQITAPKFNGRVRRFTIRAAGAVRDKRLCIVAPKKTAGTCPAGDD